MSDPSLLANLRYFLNRFMMGVSELVEEHCHMAMLVNDMDIPREVVFAQQIEKSRLKNEKKGIRMENKGFDGYCCYKNRQKCY